MKMKKKKAPLFLKKLSDENRSVEKWDNTITLYRNVMLNGIEYHISITYYATEKKREWALDSYKFYFSKSYYKKSLFYAYPIEDLSSFDLLRPYVFTIIKIAWSPALRIDKTDTYDKWYQIHYF